MHPTEINRPLSPGKRAAPDYIPGGAAAGELRDLARSRLGIGYTDGSTSIELLENLPGDVTAKLTRQAVFWNVTSIPWHQSRWERGKPFEAPSLRGSAAILPPNGLLESTRDVGDSEYFVVFHEPSRLRALSDGTAAYGLDDVDYRFNLQSPLITEIGRAIHMELTEGNPNGWLYLDQFSTGFMLNVVALARQTPPLKLAPYGLSAVVLRAVLDFVEANLAADLTVAQLAAVAGVPEASFARRFRASVGCPPYAWVTERRVERAHSLILRHPIAEPLNEGAIASAVGFSQARHLRRHFSRALGCTPHQLWDGA